MKKLFAMLLAVIMVLSLAACGNTDAPSTSAPTTTAGTEANTDTTAADTTGAAADVMTYAEYDAAAIDDAVTVECYVQATQSWWEDKITVYAQDADGAYFLYNMKCTKDDAAKLTAGTKIRVTGYKAEWSGEIEIVDATFEFVEGADTFVAEAQDVTALLGTDDLIKNQNKKVAFKGMTVVASNDAGAAYLYKWDGSGAAGDDLYFKVSDGKAEYTFCVESYLTGDGTDVYEAVEALKVGDKLDMEGFLYWYEGAQPHITSVSTAN